MPHAIDHLPLRHVPYDGTARVSTWMLSTGRPQRICLTLGTILPHVGVTSFATLVRSVLTSLARLPCELVVAVDDTVAAGLSDLPRAVRHVGRVPLSTMARSCDLLIHHGGHNSAMTALAEGCPQVVLPHFDDQIENADAVVACGAGLAMPLDSTTADQLAECCRQVLGDPLFATSAAAVARDIAAQPAPAAIAGLLDRLAQRHTSVVGMAEHPTRIDSVATMEGTTR
jgi:UDP:flavonoid glycosyltransferase YjiC (YdhE family)